jgi:hypothetical protein
MNNTSLMSANGATHVKIVAVSLLAGIVLVGVGIAARPNFKDGTAPSNRMEATGPVIKAGKPVSFSERGGGTIR